MMIHKTHLLPHAPAQQQALQIWYHYGPRLRRRSADLARGSKASNWRKVISKIIIIINIKQTSDFNSLRPLSSHRVSQLMRAYGDTLTVDMCTVLVQVGIYSPCFKTENVQHISILSSHFMDSTYMICIYIYIYIKISLSNMYISHRVPKMITSPALKSLVRHCPPKRRVISLASLVNHPVPCRPSASTSMLPYVS